MHEKLCGQYVHVCILEWGGFVQPANISTGPWQHHIFTAARTKLPMCLDYEYSLAVSVTEHHGVMVHDVSWLKLAHSLARPRRAVTSIVHRHTPWNAEKT